MRIAWWDYPVVVDLSGLTIRAGAKAYLDHDSSARVGEIDSMQIEGGVLKVSGVISSVSPEAKAVVADADNGYSWQASIGATALRTDFVDKGETVKVNGREIVGPVKVIRKASLTEVSFVGNGADDSTAARIAANAAPKGDSDMDFTSWLKDRGIEAAGLAEAQRAELQAEYDAELRPPMPPTPAPRRPRPTLPPRRPRPTPTSRSRLTAWPRFAPTPPRRRSGSSPSRN
jgi:hypothetical protein